MADIDVTLGLDTSAAEKSVNSIKKSFDRLMASFGKGGKSGDNLFKNVEKGANGLKVVMGQLNTVAKPFKGLATSIGGGINRISNGFKKLKDSSGGFFRNFKKDSNESSRAFDAFKGALGAASVIGAFVAMKNAAVGFFREAFDKTVEVEKLQTQFRVLTGNIIEGEKVLKSLQDFSASTPFQLPGIAKAGAQLISFGFEAQNITQLLGKIGDVAAGSGSDLNEVALIYGQIAAQGKLSGERLLQLQERAIPIGPALAKTMGIAESAVRDAVSKGAVDLETFEKAFASLSDESGIFFEGMQKQSKTLGGILSTLSDNIAVTQSSVGKLTAQNNAVKGALTGVITLFQRLNTYIEENGDEIDENVQSFIRFLVDGIVPVAKGFGILVRIGGELVNAFDGIKLVINETGRVIFESLISPFESLITVLTAGAKALGKEGLAKDLQQAQTVITNIKETMAETSGEWVNDIEKRRESTKKFQMQLNELALTTKQTLNQSINDQIASAEKEREIDEQRLANKKTFTAEELAEIKRRNEERAALEAERREIERLQKEDADLAELERQDRLLAERQLRDDEELQRIATNIGKEEALREQAEINRLKREKKFTEARKKRAALVEKSEKQSIFRVQKFEEQTNQQRVNNLRSTLGNIAQLQNSSNEALFAVGKAAAVSRAIIEGALAVQLALSAAPPPFNFALAAAVGAAAAINVQKIVSAKPPPKGNTSFQDGGIVNAPVSNTDNRNISVAGGEAILNRRQQTNLFNAIDRGDIGAQGNVTINIESPTGDIPPETIDRLVQGINDRTEFGNSTLLSTGLI